MFFSSEPGTLAARGLSVLRGVGAWVSIHPEQTYVATSIPGLGVCKSTYCRPERRDIARQPAAHRPGMPSARLLAVVAATIGILSGCARMDVRDVTERGQSRPVLADCQNGAEPVSPGASSTAGAATTAAEGLTGENSGFARNGATRPGAVASAEIDPRRLTGHGFAVAG